MDTQVDVDLYALDSTVGTAEVTEQGKTDYKVSVGGFAVFYASFGEGGYQVRLTRRESSSSNQSLAYVTTQLQKGDMAVALLMHPGEFEVSGRSNQKCRVFVEELHNAEELETVMQQQINNNITLTDTEFNASEVKFTQGVGLVINMETEGGFNIKLVKSNEVLQIQAKEKRHTWENPKYKYPKT